MSSELTPLNSKSDKKSKNAFASYSSLAYISQVDSPSSSSYLEENNNDIMLTPPRYTSGDQIFHWGFDWKKKKKYKDSETDKDSEKEVEKGAERKSFSMENTKSNSLLFEYGHGKRKRKKKKIHKQKKPKKIFDQHEHNSVIKSLHLFFNNKIQMTDKDLEKHTFSETDEEEKKNSDSQNQEVEAKLLNFMDSYQQNSMNLYIEKEMEQLKSDSESEDSSKPPKLNRIIPRKEINQNNKLYIRKRIHKKIWWALYKSDWFHTVIDLPTYRLFFIIISLYIFLVTVYAFLYFTANYYFFCELDFKIFLNAFDFSLETMATIGYSTKDIFFNNCISVSMILLAQVITRLFIDGLLIGLIYCRLSRPHGREITIIFSKYAVIRRIKGKLYFNFQLCELRKNQLFNPQVKMYVVKKEINYDKVEIQEILSDNKKKNRNIFHQHHLENASNAYYIQSSSMKIHHPGDSSLLLMVPQLIVHELDATSPLMPPPIWLPRTSFPQVEKDEIFSDSSNQSNFSTPPKSFNSSFPYSASKKNENINDYAVTSINQDYFTSTDSHPLKNFSYSSISSSSDIENRIHLNHYDSKNLYNLFYFSSSRLCEWYPPTYIPYYTASTGNYLPMMNPFEPPSPSLSTDQSFFPSVPSSPSSAFQSDNPFTPPSSYQHPPIPPSPSTSSINPSILSMNHSHISPYSINLQSNNHIFSPSINSLLNKQYYLHSPGLEKFNNFFNTGISDLPQASPTFSSSSTISNLSNFQPRWQIEEREMTRGYLRDRDIEVIVIVEGIDSTTGGNVQARYSYTYDDIFFDMKHKYCMYEDPIDSCLTIDFERFHQLEPAEFDAFYAGEIPTLVH